MAASLPRPPARPLPPCVPFLPHDDAAAAADPTASAVVALLNDRLEALLRADPDAFWSHLVLMSTAAWAAAIAQQSPQLLNGNGAIEITIVAT